MSRAHAMPQHPAAFHLEVHRTALMEAAADTAWSAAWIMLWLAFLLAVSTPAATFGGDAGAGEAACREPAAQAAGSSEACVSAQPDPGASGRGVARPDHAGAG